MFLVSSCSYFGRIQWRQVLSREWRCSWSSADRRCSNYIWVIDNCIAYKGAAYVRDLTVCTIVVIERRPQRNINSFMKYCLHTHKQTVIKDNIEWDAIINFFLISVTQVFAWHMLSRHPRTGLLAWLNMSAYFSRLFMCSVLSIPLCEKTFYLPQNKIVHVL